MINLMPLSLNFWNRKTTKKMLYKFFELKNEINRPFLDKLNTTARGLSV